MRVFGWIIAGILIFGALIALSVGMEWFTIEKDRALKPKRAEVEREVFENTPSYVYGMKQDIAKYQYEFLSADDDKKAAIASVVRMRFAQFDPNLLSPEQRSFLTKCNNWR